MLVSYYDKNKPGYVLSCNAALGTGPDCCWGSHFTYFSQKRLDEFQSNFHITFIRVATTYYRKEFCF